MNIELLKRLRTRFLRMKHLEHFDMHDYARTNECGTAMCIAGHALDLQGYRIRGKGSALEGEVRFISPKGKRVQAFSAARREMGLSNDEAADLFVDFSLKTPKDAAARIQELIESASDDKGWRL